MTSSRLRALGGISFVLLASMVATAACGGSDGTGGGPGGDDAGGGGGGDGAADADGGPGGGDGAPGSDGGPPPVPVTLASALAAGGEAACVLDAQGALKCWGAGKSTPEVVAAGTAFTAVDVGTSLACAIRKSDSSLMCWAPRTFAPQNQDTGQFVAVSTGASHQCAIATSGALFCWGSNNSGELGVGDTAFRAGLTQVGTETDWALVRAGGRHTCALKKSGALFCWGNNSGNELGDGVGGIVDGGAVIETSPKAIAPGTTWKDVDLTYSGTCAVRSDGTLMCWGQGGLVANAKVPTAVDSAMDWARVRLESGSACAIKLTGSLYCWGQNTFGQLGDGTRTARQTPQRVGTDSDWNDLGVGIQFACASKTDQTVRCWGSNSAGRLGSGTPDHLTPTKVGVGADWKDVSAAASAACGIKKAGANLACWGAAGLGFTAGTQEPTTLGAATTWQSVTRGDVHACARGAANDLSCWGSGSRGQLGLGNQTSVALPTSTALPALWVTAAAEHTCAIHTDNSLYCWGEDIFGKSTTTGDSNVPKKVGVDTWRRVSGGGYSTCGIKMDGTLWCWGFGLNDPMEQMGADTTWTEVVSPRSSSDIGYAIKGGVLHQFSRNQAPTPIGAAATWATISYASGHYCGVHTTGAIWCSGNNTFGQLGDGTTTTRNVPAPVGVLTDWTHVTTGSNFTCGLRNGGELYCWGSNDQGQIGDGSAWSVSPQLVK